jgi:predicted nucleotidyltransferase component of viral defense system
MNRARLNELADALDIDPVYLERDFVLTEIIRRIATGPLGNQLVLKGGLALRHVYGSQRFSKDVDYVATRRIEFDELRDALEIRQPRLTLPERPEGRTARSITLAPIRYRSLLGLESTVEMEVSFRGDLALEPQRQRYENPFAESFEVLVMVLNEMVAEKVRALSQRGHPRDLYDLWFVLTALPALAPPTPSSASLASPAPPSQVDEAVIAGLIPRKFRPTLVRGGWDYGRLYVRAEANATQWEPLLRGLVPDPPSFDGALTAVQRALRFLRAVRPIRS